MRLYLMLAAFSLTLILMIFGCAPKENQQTPSNSATPTSSTETSGPSDVGRPAETPSDSDVTSNTSETGDAATSGAPGSVTLGGENAMTTGTGAFGDAGNLPEGWIRDVPLCPGFVIDNFDASPSGMMAVCSGNVPFDEAVAFYSSLGDWTKDSGEERDWITEGSERLMTYYNENWKLMITVSEREGQPINLQIMVVK